MPTGVMFICDHCGLGATTPRGWIVVEDTRGGTISAPNSGRWRLCSWRCLREWAATFEPEPADGDANGRLRVRGPRKLVGAERDRE